MGGIGRFGMSLSPVGGWVGSSIMVAVPFSVSAW